MKGTTTHMAETTITDEETCYMRAVRAINSTHNPTPEQWAELKAAEKAVSKKLEYPGT